MIITRTPYRISFVGGGTDLRNYYKNSQGKVISTTIDKYIYVVIKRQVGIVEYKYRINYSTVEICNEINEIKHPIVREALRFFEIDWPLEITTFSDIPGQTGLGSSSAFAVGLIHGLFAIKGEMATKHKISSLAAKIEVQHLKRNIGKQDHFASAYGNLNVIVFNKDESVNIEPVFHTPEIRNELENKLMLFYTFLKRDANIILKSQNDNTQKNIVYLDEMKDLVDAFRDIINSGSNINKLGEILDHSWKLKKSLSSDISNDKINGYYKNALQSGAIGGKLLGAGGGGFLLILANSEDHNKIKSALSDLFYMPFKFDQGGTRITYYDQTTF